VDVHQAVTNMNRAERARAKLERGFMKMSIGMSQMISGAQRVTQGLLSGIQQVGMAAGAVTAVSARKFLKFEDSIAELGAVLDGGERAAQAMRKSIEKTAVASGIAGEEMSRAAALARGSGIAGAEAMEFVKEAAKGSVANYASLTSVVDAGTSVINAYGKSLFVAGSAGKKMARINDVLRISALEGKQSVEEMAQFIGLGASEASMAGVDFREFAAAYATLSLAGQGASRSVVNLNQLIRQFTSPSGKAADAAAKYGIALNRAFLKQHGGVVGALMAVNRAVDGNADALQSILGTEIRASRAVSGLVSGAENFARIQARVYGGVGETDRAFKDMSATINFQVRQALVGLHLGLARVGRAFFGVFGQVGVNSLKWFGQNLDVIEAKATSFFKRMKHGFELLGIGNLGATMRRTFDAMTSFLGSLSGQSKKNIEDLALAMVGLSVAAAPLMMLLSPFVGVIGGTVTMMAALIPLMTGFASAVGAVQAFVASLGGAGGVVVSLVAAFGSVAAALKSFGRVAAIATGVIGALHENAFGFYDVISGTVGRLWELISAIGDPIFNAATAAYEVLRDVMGAVGSIIFSVLNVALDVLIGLFKAVGAVVNYVIDGFRKLWGSAMDLGKSGIGTMINALDAASSAIRGFGQDLWDSSEQVLSWLGIIEGQAETTVSAILGTVEATKEALARAMTEKYMGKMAPLAAAFEKGRKWWAKEGADEALNLIKHTQVIPTPSVFYPLLAPKYAVQAEIKNKVCVDGRDLNVAVSTARLTINERGGSDLNPWQTHMVRTYGGGIPGTA